MSFFFFFRICYILRISKVPNFEWRQNYQGSSQNVNFCIQTKICFQKIFSLSSTFFSPPAFILFFFLFSSSSFFFFFIQVNVKYRVRNLNKSKWFFWELYLHDSGLFALKNTFFFFSLVVSTATKLFRFFFFFFFFGFFILGLRLLLFRSPDFSFFQSLWFSSLPSAVERGRTK